MAIGLSITSLVCLGVIALVLRHYTLSLWHEKRGAYIDALLERIPEVEDYNRLEVYYRRSSRLYPQGDVGYIECMINELRCLTMWQLDLRRRLLIPDEVSSVQYGMSTSVWNDLLARTDEVDKLVRRSDGKICLNNDQFRNLLIEQKSRLEMEYLGELDLLWHMFFEPETRTYF